MIRYARRAILESMSVIAPNVTANWFEGFILTPRQRPPIGPHPMPAGRNRRVPYGGGWLSVQEFGEGQGVLLMHGWGGRARDFAALIPALTSAGFRAVAYEAPAHGDSDGKRTNLLDCAGAALSVAGLLGPMAAVVGHSFGAQAAALAMNHGLSTEKLVLVGPPSDLAALTIAHAARFGVPRRVVVRANEQLARRLGLVWAELATDRLVGSLGARVLVVHDRDDANVPYHHGVAIARAARQGTLMSTNGLGHHGVLSDGDVIERVVRFVSEPRPLAPQYG